MIQNSTWKNEFEMKYSNISSIEAEIEPEIYRESPLWMQFIFCQLVQRFQMCGSMQSGRKAMATGSFFIVITGIFNILHMYINILSLIKILS